MTQLNLKTWDQFLAEKESQNEGLMDMARGVGNALGVAYPQNIADFLAANPNWRAPFEKQVATHLGNKFPKQQAWQQAFQDVQGMMQQQQPRANPAAQRGALGQNWGQGGDYVDRG